MSPGEFPYRKLPGDFRGFFRRNTLWLGPDHLLLVDSTRFSETYKRFYLADIQSIVIRKTPRFKLPYYWVLLIIAVLIALLEAASRFSHGLGWPAIAAISGMLGVAGCLYVVSMFQSCTCHLATRVNRVELSSLFRLRSAREFVRLLAPRIDAVQGELPADWPADGLERTAATVDRHPDLPVNALPAGAFSWLTVAVFVLVLTDAALTWAQLLHSDAWSLFLPNVVNTLLLAACGTVSIARLSRQRGTLALRILVLAGMFVVAAVTFGSIVIASSDQQFYNLSVQNVLDYPGMRFLGFAAIILDVMVAIPGLALAFRRSGGPLA